MYTRTVTFCVVLAALTFNGAALAQSPPAPAPTGTGTVVTSNPDGTTTVSPATPGAKVTPKDPSKASKVTLNFPIDSSLMAWVKFFADLRGMNFIITDVKELENKKVTIISNQSVSPDAAWEAFLSALQAAGYSLRQTGSTARIVKLGSESSGIRTGAPVDSDAFVTQLIQLENTRADDISKIIQGMVSPEGKIIAYPPTNTLIITDTSSNIRKMYKLMKELDVASPRSTMVIYPIKFADAADVKQIIEQLYGVAEESRSTDSGRGGAADRNARNPARPRPTTSRRPDGGAGGSVEATTAGDESKFIAQVIEDERTNSLIVLANEDGHAAVRELLQQIDRDIDVDGEIHVVYLEHAKAEEVANVLSSLSQEGRNRRAGTGGTQSQAAGAARTTGAQGRAGATTAAAEEGAEGSAAAAFDNGLRLAADEATNSLVIIASQADFQVVERVIKQLDVERKQVFVDAVIMELSSEDALDLGLAAHLPTTPSAESVGFVGAQLNANSLGLTTDALSGLALGVFGPLIDVPLAGGESLRVPAFGVVLNAIKTSGSTNIISNPSLMVLDNEKASIVVGRKIPFPTTSGLNNLGQPVISFQREDVAITLELTPRVNSSNYVTLELKLEVQEVEDSAQSQSVTAAGGGFITSQRKLETLALVADNQTMVIGGLVASTEGRSEAKVPVLGDIPLIGALFRSSRVNQRKTNLLVFLTPHIIDEPDDMVEIQRVKEAQRQEFLRRFYGKSREQFWQELQDLLQYSMNFVDERSVYRGPTTIGDLQIDGESLSDETRRALQDAIDEGTEGEPGEGAGQIPADDGLEIDDGNP